MSLIPIHNDSKADMYIAGRTIPVGETRHFDPSVLPPALRPQVAEASAPEPEPWDPEAVIEALRAGTVNSVIGRLPDLSDADLAGLYRLEEAADKPRTTLLAAIKQERLARANADIDQDPSHDGG